MAKDKTSFILYSDLIHTVRKMNKAKAGELFLTILEYVNDENPVVKDPIVDLVFEPIKRQMKRDLQKWEEEKQDRSHAGRLGGLKSGETRRSKTKQNEAKRSTASKNEANEAVNVTVTVNDTVTEKKEKERFAVTLPYHSEEFKKSWEEWLTYRIEVKKPYNSQSSIQFELQNLGRYSEPEAIEMIQISIKNGWKNIRPLELTGSKTTKGGMVY